MKRFYRSDCMVTLSLLMLPALSVMGQQEVKGVVTDGEGKTVEGVSVYYSDQPERQTATGRRGEFSLAGTPGEYLLIEVPGRFRKSVRATNDSASFSFNRHDEVIPVGFGIGQLRDEMTAAAGIAQSSVLLKNMSMNPANALLGMIPGLSVMQNGGASWENDPTLFVRGVGTMGNTAPLVLIDGFERPLSSLSLLEIENVVVLKDAATLALYGHRGANGVLLVTTKRGANVSSRVKVRLEQGVTSAFRLPELLDGYRYAQAYNQARLNDGLTAAYTPADIEKIRSGSSPFLYPDVDWLKESFRPLGTTSNLNVSFDGNSKYVKHFTTLNYQKDNGLLKPVNENEGYDTQLRYNKLNFRTNLDVAVTPSTLFKVNLSGNLRQTNMPGRGLPEIMNGIYTVPSTSFPVKTYAGEWGGTSIYSNNPVALISATGFAARQTRELLADVSLRQKLDLILPGLSAEAAVAYDNSASYLDAKTRRFRYQEIRALTDGAGTVIDTAATFFGNNTELAYSSILESQWRHATFRGKLMYSKTAGRSSIHAAAVLQQDKQVRNGQFNTYLRRLAAGHVHYAMNNRYFISGAISYSGTNMLPKASRFAVFPALSMGWKISEEDWFEKDGWLRYLKLRGSWGKTGSDLIPQNISQQQFSSAGVYYFTPNNVAAGGIMEGRLPASGLSGEVSAKSNVGFDLDFAGGFDLTIDFFHDRRNSILVESGGLNSSVIGVVTPLENAGIAVNKGLELEFNAYSPKASSFSYHFNGQFSFARNRIVAMNESFQPFDYQKRTGQRIHQAFGLEAVGYFSDEADIAASPRQLFSEVRPGDMKYRDQNGDGVVDEYDEKSIGYNLSNPELYFSGSVSLHYKGIGFFALFQGAANRTVYLNTPGIFWPLRGNSTISEFSDGSWTPGSVTAVLPRLTTLENVNNFRPNSTWLTNGSFVKIRSVELSYDLPEKLVSVWKGSSLRIYARGNNLVSFDRIKAADPENTGITYPAIRSYNLGIQVGF